MHTKTRSDGRASNPSYLVDRSSCIIIIIIIIMSEPVLVHMIAFRARHMKNDLKAQACPSVRHFPTLAVPMTFQLCIS